MKRALITLAAFAAFATPALAEPLTWVVTEESEAGLQSAQGSWTVVTEGDAVSGTAAMQLSNGSPLTYKVAGTFKDGAYTIELTDRSDSKKGCIWTGHPPHAGGTQTKGFVGFAPCSGGVKLIIRTGGVS